MSITPHDMIPLVYVDRHGNLKLSQEATEIARQMFDRKPDHHHDICKHHNEIAQLLNQVRKNSNQGIPAELLKDEGCSFSAAKEAEKQWRSQFPPVFGNVSAKLDHNGEVIYELDTDEPKCLCEAMDQLDRKRKRVRPEFTDSDKPTSDWTGEDSNPRQQLEEFTEYVMEQRGLCPQSFEQWRKSREPTARSIPVSGPPDIGIKKPPPKPSETVKNTPQMVTFSNPRQQGKSWIQRLWQQKATDGDGDAS